MIKRVVVILLITLLLAELACRIAFSITFDSSWLFPKRILTSYYPQLELMEDYQYDPDKINLLILAGSVMSPDTLRWDMNGTKIVTYFCDPAKVLPTERYNVVNLSWAGHNSLDSWYKYNYLKGSVFDAVVVYHAINDTRANNVERSLFNASYRHIEFYDDLYVIDRHQELNCTTIPFMMDWMIHSSRKRKKEYIPKELYFGLLKGNPEPFIYEGSDIKTSKSFKNNLLGIIEMGRQRGQKVLLSSYGWYHAPGYTLEKFNAHELDYDHQLFSTELYGFPENVVKGLKAHNSIIAQISDSLDQPMLDFDKAIPKKSTYFHDICHITADGCQLFCQLLEEQLN